MVTTAKVRVQVNSGLGVVGVRGRGVGNPSLCP